MCKAPRPRPISLVFGLSEPISDYQAVSDSRGYTLCEAAMLTNVPPAVFFNLARIGAFPATEIVESPASGPYFQDANAGTPEPMLTASFVHELTDQPVAELRERVLEILGRMQTERLAEIEAERAFLDEVDYGPSVAAAA